MNEMYRLPNNILHYHIKQIIFPNNFTDVETVKQIINTMNTNQNRSRTVEEWHSAKTFVDSNSKKITAMFQSNECQLEGKQIPFYYTASSKPTEIPKYDLFIIKKEQNILTQAQLIRNTGYFESCAAMAETGIYRPPVLYDLNTAWQAMLSGNTMIGPKIMKITDAVRTKPVIPIELVTSGTIYPGDEVDWRNHPLLDPIDTAYNFDDLTNVSIPPNLQSINASDAFLTLTNERICCGFCRNCMSHESPERQWKHLLCCTGLRNVHPFFFCHIPNCKRPIYYSYKSFRIHFSMAHMMTRYPANVVLAWTINDQVQPIGYDAVVDKVFQSLLKPMTVAFENPKASLNYGADNAIRYWLRQSNAFFTVKTKPKHHNVSQMTSLPTDEHYQHPMNDYHGRPVLPCIISTSEIQVKNLKSRSHVEPEYCPCEDISQTPTIPDIRDVSKRTRQYLNHNTPEQYFTNKQTAIVNPPITIPNMDVNHEPEITNNAANEITGPMIHTNENPTYTDPSTNRIPKISKQEDDVNIRKQALLKELREIEEKEKSLKQKRMNANLYQDTRRVIIEDTKKKTTIRAVGTQTATIQKPIPTMLTNNTPDNICLPNINIQDMINIKDIITESLSPVVKAIESNTEQIKKYVQAAEHRTLSDNVFLTDLTLSLTQSFKDATSELITTVDTNIDQYKDEIIHNTDIIAKTMTNTLHKYLNHQNLEMIKHAQQIKANSDALQKWSYAHREINQEKWESAKEEIRKSIVQPPTSTPIHDIQDQSMLEHNQKSATETQTEEEPKDTQLVQDHNEQQQLQEPEDKLPDQDHNENIQPDISLSVSSSFNDQDLDNKSNSIVDLSSLYNEITASEKRSENPKSSTSSHGRKRSASPKHNIKHPKQQKMACLPNWYIQYQHASYFLTDGNKPRSQVELEYPRIAEDVINGFATLKFVHGNPGPDDALMSLPDHREKDRKNLLK